LLVFQRHRPRFCLFMKSSYHFHGNKSRKNKKFMEKPWGEAESGPE